MSEPHDIDGVLMLGDEVIPGATAVIDTLRARQIPLRFVTNTTVYCRHSLLERMVALGFSMEEHELFTATYAAARYLQNQNAQSYYPLLLPDAQLEFAGLEEAIIYLIKRAIKDNNANTAAKRKAAIEGLQVIL